jgi:FkbM family methyltransferase
VNLRQMVRMVGVRLKSKKQPYYSQFGEDVVIQSFTQELRGGFYVDVGAHHPKFWSNTYALHRRGWAGVNIDLHEHNIQLFNVARPGATNICAAVSDVDAELPLYEFGPISLFNTLSKEDAEKVTRERGFHYAVRMVKTQTLTALLAAHGHGNRKIDVLSVDVEGHDLPVLRSLDFSRNQPSLICVELHEPDIRKAIESPIATFLAERGYVLASWTRPSLIFTHGVR